MSRRSAACSRVRPPKKRSSTSRALHEALEQFAAHDPLKAKLVELRFFGGLTLPEAAECLGVSLSTADRAWRYARAWLYAAMAGSGAEKK